MRWLWDVDEQNKVTVDLSPLSGRVVVRLNGAEVWNKFNWRFRREIPFELSDRRPARVVVAAEALMIPRCTLIVDEELMIPTDTLTRSKCDQCGAPVRPNDRFCDGCGAAQPTAADINRKKRVREATTTIFVLAGMFLVFGVLMFFIQKSSSTEALDNLAALDGSATYPEPIEGRTYTVAELREQVAWEPWGALGVNLVLAAVMVALGLWGKRAPLPAILAASATYAVVIVGNAIADPKTIGQGIVMKVIVILLLVKGIRAALELRTANA